MYIPEGKYKKAVYTQGGDLINENGTEYQGWYFEDYKGRIFSGKKPEKKSKRLLKLSDEEDAFAQMTFTSEKIEPTELDYENGTFTRYFLQNFRTSKIIEVTKQKWLAIKGKNRTAFAKIEWILKGPADNVKKGDYIYFGAEAKNKELVEEQVGIKNLKDYITDYREFVKD